MDVNDVTAYAEKLTPRGAIRADVNIGALIRQHGNSFYKVRLIDISETGFRIINPVTLLIGTKVYLKIPGLESLEAEVRWFKTPEYGCEFEKPLYPPVFEHIVKYISEQTAGV